MMNNKILGLILTYGSGTRYSWNCGDQCVFDLSFFSQVVSNTKCAWGALIHTASHLQEACWALLINIVVMHFAFMICKAQNRHFERFLDKLVHVTS